jgi:cytochrome c
MDSFELNKIIGAILGTLLFVMGIGFIAEAIYEPSASGPGYALPEPKADQTADNGAPAAAAVDIGTLLAKADPKAGEAAVKKCQACHDFTEGGPNKTGPNLYDVVERQIASHPGFSYSAALSAHNKDTWTYENLNAWLTSPKTFANGTKMTYAGDSDDSDRANIIAYLSTLSHSPKPFPQPKAPAGGQAPASGQTTAGSSSVAPAAGVPTPSTNEQNGQNPTPASSAGVTSASSAAEPSSAPASSAAASSASEAPTSSAAAPASSSSAAQ